MQIRKILFLAAFLLAYERVESIEVLDCSQVVNDYCYKDNIKIVYNVPGWSSTLLIGERGSNEGRLKKIEFHNGSNIINSKEFFGDVIFFEKERRVLLGQKSSHYFTKESYILDEFGGLISTIQHSNDVYRINKSADNHLIWFISHEAKMGEPYNHILVVDLFGKVVHSKNLFDSNSYVFNYNSKKYQVEVDVAELP
jgi:hypothetical protein